MKLLLAIFLLPLAAAGAEATYALRAHVQAPGQTLLIRTTTASKDAKIITDGNGTKSSKPLRVQRELTQRREVLGAPDQISLAIDRDVTESSETGSRRAALTGKSARGFRDGKGHWQFYLEGRTPGDAEALELAELAASENRGWFPDHTVKTGESWNIDPAGPLASRRRQPSRPHDGLVGRAEGGPLANRGARP